MTEIFRGRRQILRNINHTPYTNTGLWLQRYLPYQRWKEADEPVGYNKEQAIQALDRHIKHVCGIQLSPDYADYIERQRKSLKNSGSIRIVSGESECLGRLAVGLGEKGAAEVGLSLDSTWGVPIIPGSSLKGIAALASQRVGSEDWKRRDDHAEPRSNHEQIANHYDALFGDTEEMGAVIFHDARFVPAPSSTSTGLCRDVLTVHQKSYYQGNSAPSDAESPNPVSFISATGSFLFAIELHPSLNPNEHGHWLKAAWTFLKLGLLEHGVGAKTNAGYGRFKLSEWKDLPEVVQHEKNREKAQHGQELENAERKKDWNTMLPLLFKDAEEHQIDVCRSWIRGRKNDHQPEALNAWLRDNEMQFRAIAQWLRSQNRTGGIRVYLEQPQSDWWASTLNPTAAQAPVPAENQATPDREKRRFNSRWTRQNNKTLDSRKLKSDLKQGSRLNLRESEIPSALEALKGLSKNYLDNVKNAIPLAECRDELPPEIAELIKQYEAGGL